MEWFEESLTSFMSTERWPGLVVALQVIIFFFCFRILWISLGKKSQSHATSTNTLSSRAPFIFLRWGLIIAFTSILIYQATWQLGGHYRPQFVEFMQTHDKRKENNPVHQLYLGKILDRKGRPIAESKKIDGKIQRHYPYGKAFAHPVGHPRYTPYGLERLALAHLAGIALEDQEDFARLGTDIFRHRPTTQGKDLQTTLDVDLQLAAFETIGNRRGAAIAMTIPHGDIVTMVSLPAFDPNTVDDSVLRSSRDEAVLLNRCTSSKLPPGSIFKVAMAALALELNIEPQIDCPGSGYTPIRQNSPIHDHQYAAYKRRGKLWRGHGVINMSKALEESSNVYFARLLVEHIKYQAFNDLIKRLDWRDPVSIYESPAGSMKIQRLSIDAARANDPYALAQMSIGQGTILANPGQMLLLASAVANDGHIPRPRLVKSKNPARLSTVLKPSTAEKLIGMMRGVVAEGTASGINIRGLEVAGKTGSAQNPRGAAHGWFLGFAPADNPTFVICSVVENGGSGSTSALPVARAVLLEARKNGYFPN